MFGVRSLAGQSSCCGEPAPHLAHQPPVPRAPARYGDLLQGDDRRDAQRLDLECNRFDLEPEITAKIIRQGYTIHEVPIAYTPREQKKLSPWKDGLPALRALLRYRRWKPSASAYTPDSASLQVR